jgi:hypothetical protein
MGVVDHHLPDYHPVLCRLQMETVVH